MRKPTHFLEVVGIVDRLPETILDLLSNFVTASNILFSVIVVMFVL